MPQVPPLRTLDELQPNEEADLFALLAAKEQHTTRDGKPYHRVTFRDGTREISFPVWSNAPWAEACQRDWSVGVFYKLRAVYRETEYGAQLEIRKIRETVEADESDGFDPAAFVKASRFEPQAMFDDLLALVRQHVGSPLGDLVEGILTGNGEALLTAPAARRNHHAFVGGLLEHSLSVTRTALFLAEKYAAYYPEMSPPLDTALVVAAAVLHDIGKLRELDPQPAETVYTCEGALVGHILLGRDMVREAAAAMETPPDRETLLRLEHAVITHQRLPEWGSPKPPMTPEAMLVHYADDLDAKFHMMVEILREDRSDGPLTSKRNILMQPLFRGPA